MRTSPEYPLKRLLAAGIADCYELGRVFRNGEAGRRHNPEFTMLEWYRVGWDHRRLMREACELVVEAMAGVEKPVFVIEQSYSDLFSAHLGFDALHAPVERLRSALGDLHIDAQGLSHDDWLDLLLTHRLQPRSRATASRSYTIFPRRSAPSRGSARAIRRWPSDSSCSSGPMNSRTATTN